MRGMGRTKTVHKDLPPRMVARAMANGRRLYYYKAGGKKIPLGDDLNTARMEWARIEAGNNIAPQTVKAISERYKTEILPSLADKTQHEYKLNLKRIEDVFGKETIGKIKPTDVRRYLDKRKAKIMANREIACLSILWSYAREWGYVDGQNPCYKVRRNKEAPREIYIEDEQFNAVFAEADQPLQDAMLLAYYTGQRLADVLKMTRADIKDGAVWVEQNKSKRKDKAGKKIAIELIGEFGQIVNELLTRKRTATGLYLVQTDKGRPLTYSMLRNRFDDAREAAGVSFQFRDIRPKAATDSGSLEEAQALLGHQTAATTKRHYRHVERVKPVHKK